MADRCLDLATYQDQSDSDFIFLHSSYLTSSLALSCLIFDHLLWPDRTMPVVQKWRWSDKPQQQYTCCRFGDKAHLTAVDINGGRSTDIHY